MRKYRILIRISNAKLIYITTSYLFLISLKNYQKGLTLNYVFNIMLITRESLVIIIVTVINKLLKRRSDKNDKEFKSV